MNLELVGPCDLPSPVAAEAAQEAWAARLRPCPALTGSGLGRGRIAVVHKVVTPSLRLSFPRRGAVTQGGRDSLPWAVGAAGTRGSQMSPGLQPAADLTTPGTGFALRDRGSSASRLPCQPARLSMGRCVLSQAQGPRWEGPGPAVVCEQGPACSGVSQGCRSFRPAPTGPPRHCPSGCPLWVLA